MTTTGYFYVLPAYYATVCPNCRKFIPNGERLWAGMTQREKIPDDGPRDGWHTEIRFCRECWTRVRLHDWRAKGKEIIPFHDVLTWDGLEIPAWIFAVDLMDPDAPEEIIQDFVKEYEP